LQGQPKRLHGPGWTPRGELGPFSLPDLVSELTLGQECPGFERTLTAFPREDELATGNPGQQDHGGIVIYSGLEKLGLGCQRRDLAEGRTFQPGGEVLADLPDDPSSRLLQPGRSELPLLEHQAQPQPQKCGAREENRRKE
jgi:hypothetical protein